MTDERSGDDEHDEEEPPTTEVPTDGGGGGLRVDPDAPGRSLFEDGDAVEPNEPG
jgi:hypothetical protein